jgi:hypothetical protein
MEATRYSETSVDFQRTTWRYIPQEKILYLSKTCLLVDDDDDDKEDDKSEA